MVCEQVTLGADEIFDFLVDLNGGALGALVFFRGHAGRPLPVGPGGV